MMVDLVCESTSPSFLSDHKQPHLAPVGAYLPCQGGTSGAQPIDGETKCSPNRGKARQGGKGVVYVTYNSGLTEYARENRIFATRVEGIFWHLVLKKKKFFGFRFRRQKIISSFILDFYCSELLLGIELDGGYHNDRIDYDRYRDAEISKKGILVIRFQNEDIEKNLSGVMSELQQIIKERREIFLLNSTF
ncbi:MAG: DUF559 domain-containing protein [candidate division SR1 bacterium]|nr:DUF559 domain-containing protein [candidate division SR1 bacterium]